MRHDGARYPVAARVSARLEELTPGARVRGIEVAVAVTVIDASRRGSIALTLTYREDTGHVAQTLLYHDREPSLSIEKPSRAYAFDCDSDLWRPAVEADIIKMAALFDPMLPVTTSDLEPLPHQIKAVYGEFLSRTTLRFLLADDSASGKTIMVGLYIKELMLRGDLARCLIVAPGGLVEQWQEELLDKFGLRFELLTRSLVDSTIDQNVFERHPLLVARMDQLSRSDELQQQLEQVDYVLVIVDEAHRMSARYVPRYLDAEDLIDARWVAELLRPAQRNMVSAYQRRYPGMPRPVVDLGQGSCKRWLRSKIERWRSEQQSGTAR